MPKKIPTIIRNKKFEADIRIPNSPVPPELEGTDTWMNESQFDDSVRGVEEIKVQLGGSDSFKLGPDTFVAPIYSDSDIPDTKDEYAPRAQVVASKAKKVLGEFERPPKSVHVKKARKIAWAEEEKKKEDGCCNIM